MHNSVTKDRVNRVTPEKLDIAVARMIDRHTRPLPLRITDPDLDAAFRSIDVSKYRTPRGPSPFSRDHEDYYADQRLIDGEDR